jgi:3-(3-hydroxy-phenyl)propionate hydroxylase
MKFKPEPRFRDGFLIADDETPKRTLVGRMLPQPDVTLVKGITMGGGADGNTTKLDDVMGAGFCLLAIGTDAAAGLARLDHPVWAHLAARRVALIPGITGDTEQVVSNDTEILHMVGIAADAISRKLGPYKGKILLVRPDRYVAAAYAPGDAGTMAETLAAQIGIVL